MVVTRRDKIHNEIYHDKLFIHQQSISTAPQCLQGSTPMSSRKLPQTQIGGSNERSLSIGPFIKIANTFRNFMMDKKCTRFIKSFFRLKKNNCINKNYKLQIEDKMSSKITVINITEPFNLSLNQTKENLGRFC